MLNKMKNTLLLCLLCDSVSSCEKKSGTEHVILKSGHQKWHFHKVHADTHNHEVTVNKYLSLQK